MFVVGCSEGLLPISYASTPAEVEEERRLLYVGVTRARDRLRLSWARSAAPRPGERRPSRFLGELTPAGRPTGTSSARARVAAVG